METLPNLVRDMCTELSKILDKHENDISNIYLYSQTSNHNQTGSSHVDMKF